MTIGRSLQSSRRRGRDCCFGVGWCLRGRLKQLITCANRPRITVPLLARKGGRRSTPGRTCAVRKAGQERGRVESRPTRRERLARARLYLVLEARPHREDPSPLLEAALRGGVDVVQLRDKELDDGTLIDDWVMALFP